MLSPLGIIIRIRCLHHILSENKADWSIFPGAVQFLISPKYNVFQSTQAASTRTISFYIFIPMKINTVYLFIYEKFDSSALISRMNLIEYPSYGATRPVTNSCRYWYVPGKCSVCHFSNKSIKKPGLSVIYCSLLNIDWCLVYNRLWPKTTANLVSLKF